jgi:hypothetical protein
LLRKSMPMVAWYVLSNVSYINLVKCQAILKVITWVTTDLVMRLVLPTLWSPSNTIFVRFNVPDETSVVGDVGLAMSERI